MCRFGVTFRDVDYGRPVARAEADGRPEAFEPAAAVRPPCSEGLAWDAAQAAATVAASLAEASEPSDSARGGRQPNTLTSPNEPAAQALAGKNRPETPLPTLRGLETVLWDILPAACGGPWPEFRPFSRAMPIGPTHVR